jgi:hypothetical protein
MDYATKTAFEDDLLALTDQGEMRNMIWELVKWQTIVYHRLTLQAHPEALRRCTEGKVVYR